MRQPIESIHAMPAPPPANRMAEPARELELIDYVAAVLTHRWLVLGLAFGLAVVAAAVSLLGPRQYQASALISVTPPRIEGPNSIDSSPEGLIPVIRSEAIVAGVIAHLKLDRDPYALSPARFVRSSLSVDAVPETTFLEVKVTLPDPEMARQATDALASRAVTRAQQIGAEEGGGVEEQLHKVSTQSEERFRKADATLKEYKTRTQIELLREDVKARLGQRGDFLKLLVEIAAERGRLARAEQEVSARPEVDTTTDTITRNPTLTEAARSEGGSGSLLGLAVESQRVNPARKELDVEMATTRAKLAALERQRDRMIELSQVNASALPLLTDLYEKEATLARLQLDYDVAKKTFEEAAQNHHNAKLRTALHTPFIQVVERATLPSTPQSRYMVRNAAIGLVVGLTLGCLYAFTRLAMARISALPRAAGSGTHDA